MMKLPCLNDPEWAREVEAKTQEREEAVRRMVAVLSINETTIEELQNYAVKVALLLNGHHK
jgi:hypothetical protein